MGRINGVSDGIGAEGLNQLNRDLRAIGKEAQGDLRKANVEVAEKEGKRVQSAAVALGGVAAHVAPSIKGGGSTTYAAIKGGSGQPAFAGAEFGGRGRPTTQQFQPWRGKQGYFLFPTLRRDNESITNQWTEAIDDLMKRHGL